MARPPSTSTSEPVLRAALALCGAGSLVVLVGLLGLAGRLAGAAALLAGVVLAAPCADRGSGLLPAWWPALAAGTALVLAGAGLGLLAGGIGGLVAACGAVVCLSAAVLAYPTSR